MSSMVSIDVDNHVSDCKRCDVKFFLSKTSIDISSSIYRD